MSVSVDLPLQNTPAARTKAPSGYWAGVWRRLRRDPMTVAFALVLLTISGMAMAAPLIAPADPYKTSMLRRLLPPGAPQHLLGTDELGRDTTGSRQFADDCHAD
jgi:peptide/nickel transport system permease protein